MDNIYSKRDILIGDETLTKHISKRVRYKRINTVSPLLKRTGRIVNRERIKPIEIHKVFETIEMNTFFDILYRFFNPAYQFFFIYCQ